MKEASLSPKQKKKFHFKQKDALQGQQLQAQRESRGAGVESGPPAFPVELRGKEVALTELAMHHAGTPKAQSMKQACKHPNPKTVIQFLLRGGGWLGGGGGRSI